MRLDIGRQFVFFVVFSWMWWVFVEGFVFIPDLTGLGSGVEFFFGIRRVGEDVALRAGGGREEAWGRNGNEFREYLTLTAVVDYFIIRE